MRPSVILGFIASVAAAVTIVASVHADSSSPPPPTFAVTSSQITVSAQGKTHLNSKFPWSFKDATGTKVKTANFAFPSDPAPTVTVTGIAPAANTTLRGGYCLDTGCYTFTASCTASSCTITGT
jgi:hypothetical protein